MGYQNMALRIDQKPLNINSIKTLKAKDQKIKKNNSDVTKRRMDNNFKRIKSNSAQEKSEGIIYNYIYIYIYIIIYMTINKM